jgi:hypothetical protein
MSLKIKLKNRCNIFLNLKKTALSNILVEKQTILDISNIFDFVPAVVF